VSSNDLQGRRERKKKDSLVKNITTTAYNATPVERGHNDASNNKIKGYF
jgi:hypothetical protein